VAASSDPAAPAVPVVADGELDRLRAGYLEARRVAALELWRTMASGGLLDGFGSGWTAAQAAAAWDVPPGRLDAVGALLRTLAGAGALQRSGQAFQTLSCTPPVAVVTPGIEAALGQREAAGLLVGGDGPAPLFAALRRPEQERRISTVARQEHDPGTWDAAFTLPYYACSRRRAVAAVAGCRDVLDLGSGTGLGLLELRAAGVTGELVGVERVAAFRSLARERVGDAAEIVAGDLEDGLPDLPPVDGVIAVGCLHFVAGWRALVREVGAVLRPGGLFCVAHDFAALGTPDQPIVELAMLLGVPPVRPRPAGALGAAAAEAGLTPVGSGFSIGCFGWRLFRRRSGPVPLRDGRREPVPHLVEQPRGQRRPGVDEPVAQAHQVAVGEPGHLEHDRELRGVAVRRDVHAGEAG
jgi:SAM-dependent methyltransferase